MSEPTPTISPPSVSRDEAADLTPETASPTPPPEWQADAERLRERLQELQGQVDERLNVLLESIEQDLFDPLQSAAHEAAAIHAALVKTSHFDTPVDEVAPNLRWKRVRDYRRDTMSRVIAPLRRRLAALSIGTTLNERWQAFWDDLASLPSSLPVSITRAEPDALYAPSPEDSLFTTLRKHLVQARRRFQLGAKPVINGRFYAQEVPLRTLAAYHLRVRLPRHLDEQAIYQHFARAVASFERAVTTWTHRLLDAERHLDAPAYHRPERFEAPSSHATNSGEGESLSSEPQSLPPSEVWTSVRDEAKALNDQLRTLASLEFDEHPARVQSTVQESWSELETDIDQADSFLLARQDRTIPVADPEQQDEKTASHWPSWYQQATNRLAFCEQLTALRDATYQQQESLLRALIDAGVQPVCSMHADASHTLRELHDEAAALFDDETDPEALAVRLSNLLDRSLHVADAELVERLQEARLLSSTRSALDDHLAQFTLLPDDAPTSFELHSLVPPSTEAITPDSDAREINLESIAEEHFDVFFADALRDALQPFHQRLDALIREDQNVPSVLRFNLGAALEELDDASAVGDTEAVQSARELALNGLARSADAIDAQTQHVQAALASLTSAAGTAFLTAWTDLHDRARAESRIREHLLELRTLVARETQEATERAERRFREARVRLQRALRLGRGRAEELAQKGRSAVGAGAFSEDAFTETLEALASTEHALANLPLVYRRLFSFRPVTDPALLVGRDDDLARLQRYINQWQHGLTNAMVITGHYGNGLTSFLNVAQKTLLSDADVHWLELDDRLRSESAFAERIARTLDLPLSASDDEPLTLDQVREHLLAQPRPDAPRVCIVEHLEHLFLRAVNGTELIGRVLTFMSRTDSRVLWLSTISEYGWQLLDTTAPMASSLVLQHHLAPIDRSDLEVLIMTRHQRSGLQITFEAPAEPNPLLRRRLRKAHTDEHEQTILREEYFDRLHTQCGSNIMLALFYWSRSVRLNEETLVMHVDPIRPLNFGFLEGFTMQQAFALKSLLDHATLTVEEYSETAQVPRDTSLALFESLGNALLLQPADATSSDAESPFATIEPTRRYRIRPLIIHPVMEYLRSKNILH